ncbi:MAG: PAS domain-containing protein [bacterium]|nr:PAS domain-containing protein [bacterium]
MANESAGERDVEREFKVDELFFSTTDTKGIILYGNEVFTRIAGYEFSELVGKPHNIIRHSDVPRCVFKLVWDYLEAGKTVSGYVKNKAKDGSYYWVLAILMPCRDGYLSIRLKPSSELFTTVQGVYKSLLELENNLEASGASRKDAIAASTDKLLEVLTSVGFADYDEFMTTALVAEMKARDELSLVVAHGSKATSGKLKELYDKCHNLDEQLALLCDKVSAYYPINNDIIEKAGSILETADSVREMSLGALNLVGIQEKGGNGEVGGRNVDMTKRTRILKKYLNEIMFAVQASKLKVEMTKFFINEVAGGGAGNEKDLQHNIDLLVESCASSSKDISANFQRYILRIQIALQAFE